MTQTTSRHDGLTPERQSAFLDALAASGSVSAAAEAIGISRTAIYNLRNQPDAAPFRAAWDDALKNAVAVLSETAFERALNGVEEPVFHKGEQVGTRRRHNDRLLMFLLKTLDPDTYGPRKPKAEAPDADIFAAIAEMAKDRASLSTLSTSREANGNTASMSTSSTSQNDDMDDDIFRTEPKALRSFPSPLTYPLSKRNARRLAAKNKQTLSARHEAR